MLKFAVNENPPFPSLPILGLQHTLTMLGGTIAVPTIIAQSFGLDVIQTAEFISNVLIAMGLATLLQVLIGSRLPIVQGSSFAFVPAILYVSTLHPGIEGLAYVSGSVILCAFLQIILGLSGAVDFLKKIFTPVVVGPTIMIIGISLFSVGGAQASSNWLISIPTIAIILVCSFGFLKNPSFLGKYLAMFPVILAIALMWIICFFLSQNGFFLNTNSGYVSLDVFDDAAIIKTSSYIMPWGIPKIDLLLIPIFVVSYIVSTIESIGDYNAVNDITHRNPKKLTSRRIGKGIFSEGLGCVIAGILGSNPTTSYSENIGVIGATGVASRRVIIAAALFLILMGVFPIFTLLLATIPSPIMGGVYCVLFGIIIGIGIKYSAKSDLSSMRNVTIIGMSLFVGLAVPSAFQDTDLLKTLNEIIVGLVTSNMAMTALCALALDMTLPKPTDPAQS